MNRRNVGAVAVAALVSSCTPTMIPPPPEPARFVPELASLGPPPPGKGQITINADKPSLVEQVTGHYEGVARGHRITGLTFATVCPSTPCVANVDLGEHPLRLTSLADANDNGDATISVGPQPSAFNYNLGHNVAADVRWVAPISLAIPALITGLVFAALGQPGGSTVDPAPNFRPLGFGLLIGGGALTALAIWMGQQNNGSTQNGTGVQWPLGPPSASAWR